MSGSRHKDRDLDIFTVSVICFQPGLFVISLKASGVFWVVLKKVAQSSSAPR